MKLRTQKLVTYDKRTTKKKIKEGLGNEKENNGTRSWQTAIDTDHEVWCTAENTALAVTAFR